MKKFLSCIFIASLLFAILGLTACSEKGNLAFKTLTFTNNEAVCTLSNATATFSFEDEITVNGKSEYTIAYDEQGQNTVPADNAPLNVGENTFYIIERLNDKVANTYTVTIYRRQMCMVSFNSNGGAAVESQLVEEGTLATQPESVSTLGNIFDGWDYDFSTPITKTTEINAKFIPKDEMANFTFTSTQTTCVITGITNKNVTKLTVPNYVTAIEKGAFRECARLSELTIPFVGADKTNETNTYLGYIFGADSYIANQTTVPISLKKVTVTQGEIGDYAFYSCKSLTDIKLPANLTTIGDYAFCACSGLTGINIPKSVTDIGYSALAYCSKLTEITLDGESANLKTVDGNLYSKDGKTLIQYAIGKPAQTFSIPEGVATIGACAFEDCNILTSINIPDSVTKIEPFAFYGCENLTTIAIPNDVSYIGASAFAYCHNLKSINIPDKITTIYEYTFVECKRLNSVVISVGVTTIDNYAFFECTGLRYVYYSGDAEMWSALTKNTGHENHELTSKTIYYYSSSTPTDDGNYWYYKNNTPTVWKK